MRSAFDSNSKYHTGEFKCSSCNHETIIFIDTKYDMFGSMETDKICCICNEVKDIVANADLILRYDWPDADDNPWQLQGATLKDEERYCKKCQKTVKRDWKKFIVACSKCDGYMEFTK
jgi:transcription elongation factor Elf1